jgi:prepilin-type N-terminal cleavage/methylation domain-containing protein
MKQLEKGFALVESLVAIALVGIAMVGATSLVITVTNANTASRGYTSLISDVYTIVDNYRNTSYNTLLNKFGSNPIAIANGQTVVETSTGNAAKASYTTNLVAIKTTSGAVPEAIRVEITATQRRGIFNDSTFSFQTLIAPTS